MSALECLETILGRGWTPGQKSIHKDHVFCIVDAVKSKHDVQFFVGLLELQTYGIEDVPTKGIQEVYLELLAKAFGPAAMVPAIARA